MHPAASIVEEYLRVLMIPDPDTARRYLGPEFEIRFTGNRPMHDPAECAAFNAKRYKWVKKRFGPTHVAEGGTGGTSSSPDPTRRVVTGTPGATRSTRFFSAASSFCTRPVGPSPTRTTPGRPSAR